ncbi:hypothetical protein H5410_009667, partial [Solanum commersonii]
SQARDTYTSWDYPANAQEDARLSKNERYGGNKSYNANLNLPKGNQSDDSVHIESCHSDTCGLKLSNFCA